MRFRDFTIVNGAISSQRLHNTTALVPSALEVTDHLFSQAQSVGGRVSHGVHGLPAFDVALGSYFLNELFVLKGCAPRVTASAPARLFGVFAPGHHSPICYNIVLPATPAGDMDELVDSEALGAFAALSVVGLPQEEATHAMQALVSKVWNQRPFLATTLTPFALLTEPKLIRIVADFETCFAASMLRHSMHPASEPSRSRRSADQR